MAATTNTGNGGDREELVTARRIPPPSAEARHNPEVKSHALEQEEGDDGKPEIHVSIQGEEEEAPRTAVVEEEKDSSEPGVRIEEMDDNWTKQASTPATPGAVLKNVRSVYSELSDEILVRLYVGGTVGPLVDVMLDDAPIVGYLVDYFVYSRSILVGTAQTALFEERGLK